jgi:glutamine amidotransferase PdxT
MLTDGKRLCWKGEPTTHPSRGFCHLQASAVTVNRKFFGRGAKSLTAAYSLSGCYSLNLFIHSFILDVIKCHHVTLHILYTIMLGCSVM